MSNNQNTNAETAAVANGAQPAKSSLNGVVNAVLRGIVIWMGLNFISARFAPTATSNNTNDTPKTSQQQEQPSKMKPLGAELDLTYPGMKKTNAINTMKPKCVWDINSIVDLHVYITDRPSYPIEHCESASSHTTSSTRTSTGTGGEEILAQWHEEHIVLGPSSSSISTSSSSSSSQVNNNSRSTNVTIPMTNSVINNTTHVYAHVCMIKSDHEVVVEENNDNNKNKNNRKKNKKKNKNDISKNVFLKSFQLTTHRKRKRMRDEKNLLDDNHNNHENEKDDSEKKTLSSTSTLNSSSSPLTIASANKTQDAILLYLKPKLTLQLVNLRGLPLFAEKRAIPQPIQNHMAWYNYTTDSNDKGEEKEESMESNLYYPIVYSSEFWMLKSSYIEVNDTLPYSNLEITFDDASFWKWQLMSQMEEQWTKQAKMQGDEDDKGNDMLRTMLLETNPILLLITAIVTILHTVFDVLAFKNDINFFKGKKSMEGISLRSMVINTAFQLVILLYLFDNDTSFMILASNGVGVAIEMWKISKAVKLSLFDEQGKLSFQWKESDSYSKSTTKEYDEIATDHLMFVTMPLVCGYGLYSLLYQKHKGWYSWILNTLVGFIYMFGFVMMTPQVSNYYYCLFFN